MDARPTCRLLNGHSSGGWATLQLQVNYPQVFGGTWSTSPDPSDFHDFTGPDLYAPNANLYRRPDGSLIPIFRDHGKVIATLEQFGHLKQSSAPTAASSPPSSGSFLPRATTARPSSSLIARPAPSHPNVVAYWHDHYDLAHIVESNWSQRGPALKGRIHLFVGTADTFYLDGPAHKFEAVLKRLGADPHFTYIPDRTHFDLYKVGDDPQGLFDQIGAEMYSTARPGEDWKKK